MAFEDLTADDAAFLTGKTGIDAERIGWLAEAARRARDVGAEGVKPIPAEAFYGLFRKDVPTALEAILRTPLETTRAVLEAALAETIVPAALRDQLDQILKALQALQVEMALAPAKEDQPPSLGDLLGALPERLEPGREAALAAAVGPGGTDSLREEQLDDLVRRRKLTRAQARGHRARRGRVPPRGRKLGDHPGFARAEERRRRTSHACAQSEISPASTRRTGKPS